MRALSAQASAASRRADGPDERAAAAMRARVDRVGRLAIVVTLAARGMTLMFEALELGWSAMRFEGSAFRSVLEDGAAARHAHLLLLLSALMLAASQSVVLFANQVPPLRFILALMVAGVRYAALAIGFGLAFMAAGRLLGVAGAGQASVLSLVALAWAPGLLALFSVVPHFGLGWQRIIDAWIAALMVAGLAIGMGVGLPAAVLVGLVGWLLGQGANMAVGPLLVRLNRFVMNQASGRILLQDADPVAVLRAQAADPALLKRPR